MIIKNVKVYTEDEIFTDGMVVIRDGRFDQVLTDAGKVKATADMRAAADLWSTDGECFDDEVIDGEGAYAIPGLIDIHFHGCKGYDFCDGTKEAIAEIARYEASIGVTGICPATMTLPVDELTRILSVAASYAADASLASGGQMAESGREDAHGDRKNAPGADLLGINMEGPFISTEKKGAQDERSIIPCDAGICGQFLDASEGLVKFVGIAPERNGDFASFIGQVKDKVNVSLAHTNADYDTAKAAFDAGACHAVHLYNAMPVFTHRTPGVVGAVSDSPQVNAELICDGVHIHPSVVRATFKMMGADRMILISDSMRATGMPDGRYLLGGLEVDVAGSRATLVSNGALAGSATNLMDCMRTAVKKMGIPLETAVACATKNPAKALGEYEDYGSIAPGKKADVVLLDQELKIKAVIKGGVKI